MSHRAASLPLSQGEKVCAFLCNESFASPTAQQLSP